MVLLGGPVFGAFVSLEQWADAHVEKGYRSCYLPPDHLLSNRSAEQHLKAVLADRGLVLAEVGAWCNPLSANPEEARAAKAHVIDRLALADRLGARACVNIIGSASPTRWDGADREGYSQEFFERAVDCYRKLVREVEPSATAMCFEAMPYYFLDGPEPYLEFLEALDCGLAAGVHLDICNMVNDPRRYYGSGSFCEAVIGALGSQLRSAHLKDLQLDDAGGTVKFKEVLPGTGGLDLGAYLRAIDLLPQQVPVLLEHLETEEEYAEATDNVKNLAKDAGVLL